MLPKPFWSSSKVMMTRMKYTKVSIMRTIKLTSPNNKFVSTFYIGSSLHTHLSTYSGYCLSRPIWDCLVNHSVMEKKWRLTHAWTSRAITTSRFTSGFGVSTFIALPSKSGMACPSRRLPLPSPRSRVTWILYPCKSTIHFPSRSRSDVF
jgi:hypothetical protein